MKPFTTTALPALLGAILSVIGIENAQASCGASFCTINTSWNMQGAAIEPGWRLDLRAEYIDQDQPMAGSDEKSVGQIRRHHDEVKTRNRNLLATLDYAFNDQWSISATAPLVDRKHFHIHNHRGAKLPERWEFTRLGDMRVLGRYQMRSEDQEKTSLSFYGLNAGVKLPTGQIHVDNSAGDRAERSLQPGSGTTDLLLGAYYSRLMGTSSAWTLQALWQEPMNSREQYKPGGRLSLDAGYRYEVASRLGLMLQLNYLSVERDSGANAERADSGGKYVYLSPGVSFDVTPRAQLYLFVQQPLYQYVNGVQLTADWTAASGVSVRF